MDYRIMAKKMLEEHTIFQASVHNLRLRIREIDQLLAAPSAYLAVLQMEKRENAAEKRRKLIAEREQYEVLLSYRLSCIGRVERGLEVLNEEQKMILEWFYIHRKKNRVSGLMQRLGYERRTIYYRCEAALQNFTMAMYGCITDELLPFVWSDKQITTKNDKKMVPK